MARRDFNDDTLGTLQKLIEANFTGRDELYAVAAALDEEARRIVCLRMAEHLAGHAAELQQRVTASGAEPAEPLETKSTAKVLFELAKINHGERGVLDAAAEGEHNLRKDYDRAIEETHDSDAKEMLRQQRDDVEFGENVLRGMSRAGTMFLAEPGR